jgi:bifunctional NMN adenylyltransferase/nudix hydrolase
MLSVIIGRFQTPHLHEGHQELIRAANNFSKNVLVLIGCTAAIGTDKNPLDFETRKKIFENKMLCEIKPLHDMVSDSDWSDQIDKIIDDLGFKEATIFGGKDNSIKGYYDGKHRIKIINDIGIHSATALRKAIGMSNPKSSEDFRAGIIYAAENRYPIVYSTVDVIVKNDNKYLVGKKGDKYCFVGGFVDPSDNTLQAAAIRELKEETGITDFGDIDYCGSIKIDDVRYKETKDSIMTHCFLVRNARDLENEIQDKEFKDFVWATREELEELLHNFHKPLLTFIS